ncbi:MAG: hypothetical protein KDA61_03115 [Planctomycetales bacterium]|nr:hypothetical protein [Planctomycetales bacterium]
MGKRLYFMKGAVLMAAVAVSGIGGALAEAQEASAPESKPSPSGREARPVSWVNPLAAAEAGLVHCTLPSDAVGESVGYVVWTPPGYADDPSQRYPVVYFLHGMGGNESSDAAGFSGHVRDGIRAGAIPPCIVVFPNGGRSGYRDAVERMIVDELAPTIDANYRTQPNRARRVAIGFSMGGQGAVRLAVRHPDLFCAAASWGGGLFRGGEEVLDAVDEQGAQLREQGFAALLINGDEDRPEAYHELVKHLAAQRLEHALVVLPSTPHKLGRYYELSAERTIAFLGERLKRQAE